MNPDTHHHEPPHGPPPARPRTPRDETRRFQSSTLAMAMTFGLSVVASPEGLRVRTAPPSHPRRPTS